MIVPALFLMIFLGAEPSASGARVSGASSTLADKTRVMEWSGAAPRWRAATFKPASAMDGSLATAWCEGARGSGSGEWISFELDRSVDTLEIEPGFRKLLLPGAEAGENDPEQLEDWFQQSLRTYRSNGRPSVIEVLVHEGEVIERLQLGDRYFGRYRFHLRLEPGKYRLRIAEVNAGTRFEDTCISEIRLDRSQPPRTPDTLPAALAGLSKSVRCSASAEVKHLPREVRVLSADGGTLSNSPTARFAISVRTSAGRLLPISPVSCHWGQKSNVVACTWAGEETEPEALDDASLDLPAWSGKLETSPQSEGSGVWTGRHQARGSEPIELKVRVTVTGELGRLSVTAARSGEVIETASYTCSAPH